MPRHTQETIDKVATALKLGKMNQAAIGRKLKVSQQFVKKVKEGVAIARVEPTVAASADPTDARVLQLEAKEVANKDEIRRLKLAYKAAQRKNSLFEAIADEARTTITPIKPLPKVRKVPSSEKKIRESCVLCLSDGHHDAVIKPHQVAGLESHDFNIALRRAEQYVDTVIRFTQRTLANYDFHTLYILAHGDHTSGDIHGSVDHSHYRNAFRNCLAIGQMHSLIFRDLAAVFPKIHVLYLSGNHGRRTPKKEYHGPMNNWDYLVAKVAEQHCANLENVDFLIPDSFSANLEIEGHGFTVSHGDDIRSFSGLPWYGIERKVRRWTALNAAVSRKISYYHFGHFHTATSMANLNGEVLINGAWIATDPYVYNSLSTFNEPCQIMHGVHRDHGISWRLHVKLRTERENLGPTRYSVLLDKELLP